VAELDGSNNVVSTHVLRNVDHAKFIVVDPLTFEF